MIIVYVDGGNSNYGTAIIGFVSGTSITFGTPAVFNSNYTLSTSMAFDETQQVGVVCYCDVNDSERGKAKTVIPATTTLSFGTASTFEFGAAADIDSAYIPDQQKVAVVYRDTDSSARGTVAVGQVTNQTTISSFSPHVYRIQ